MQVSSNEQTDRNGIKIAAACAVGVLVACGLSIYPDFVYYTVKPTAHSRVLVPKDYWEPHKATDEYSIFLCKKASVFALYVYPQQAAGLGAREHCCLQASISELQGGKVFVEPHRISDCPSETWEYAGTDTGHGIVLNDQGRSSEVEVSGLVVVRNLLVDDSHILRIQGVVFSWDNKTEAETTTAIQQIRLQLDRVQAGL